MKGPTIIFFDVAFSMVGALLFLVVIMWPHINPITDNPFVERPDHMIVEIKWPAGDIDVDLWVAGPAGEPIGYSNRGGPRAPINLLRDDVGVPDLSENWEIQMTRGILPGRYDINVHMFKNKAAKYPLEVKVAVLVKHGRTTKELLVKKVVLVHIGQELTVFRFILLDDGTLSPGSLHDSPISLRSDP